MSIRENRALLSVVREIDEDDDDMFSNTAAAQITLPAQKPSSSRYNKRLRTGRVGPKKISAAEPVNDPIRLKPASVSSPNPSPPQRAVRSSPSAPPPHSGLKNRCAPVVCSYPSQQPAAVIRRNVSTQPVVRVPAIEPKPASSSVPVVSGIIKRHRNRYPPPYPRVPPHGSDPTWRKVPFAPVVRAHSTGPTSARVEWDEVRGVKNTAAVRASTAWFEVFVCQETSAPPDASMWHLTGRRVRPLPLPMYCDISGLPADHAYHFAVRPVDVHGRRAPCGVGCVRL